MYMYNKVGTAANMFSKNTLIRCLLLVDPNLACRIQSMHGQYDIKLIWLNSHALSHI